jgi:uncharacterized protein (TIGR00645 family)
MIFFSRWLQAPLYIGLIIAQLVYVVVFVIELIGLSETVWLAFAEAAHTGEMVHVEESTIMLGVLGLIDVVMIANLLIMVIIGGYETFVSKIKIDGHPDQPEWLSHVNANVLKTKLAMAIVGISSIHLLKTFIGVGTVGPSGDPSTVSETNPEESYTWDGVLWQVIIHMVFIISAIALAWIDRMSQTPIRGAHHSPVSASAPTLGSAIDAPTSRSAVDQIVVPEGYMLVPISSHAALPQFASSTNGSASTAPAADHTTATTGVSTSGSDPR